MSPRDTGKRVQKPQFSRIVAMYRHLMRGERLGPPCPLLPYIRVQGGGFIHLDVQLANVC